MNINDNKKPPFDKEIVNIAEYVCNYIIDSPLAYQTAYYDLLDSLACAFMALKFSDCTRVTGTGGPRSRTQQRFSRPRYAV